MEKGIEPIIVFTKSDLADAEPLLAIYRQAGITAFSYSIHSPQDRETLLSLLNGKISAFTGNTGVGKSSLLNSLFPELSIETAEISRKLGRGRHTTRHSELYKVGGGYAADTPGFSSVDIERYEVIMTDELADCFPEFGEYLTQCRFSTCSHTCEKGCAVLNAVKEGKIPLSRHNSYKAMYEEVKNMFYRLVRSEIGPPYAAESQTASAAAASSARQRTSESQEIFLVFILLCISL